MGGQAEQVGTSLREHHAAGAELAAALRVAVDGLKAGAPPGAGGAANGGERTLTGANLEVAMLDRTRARRLFKRIPAAQLDALLAQTGGS